MNTEVKCEFALDQVSKSILTWGRNSLKSFLTELQVKNN